MDRVEQMKKIQTEALELFTRKNIESLESLEF